MQQDSLFLEQPFHGERLRLARSWRGFSLASLAERVATSAPYLHQLETGERQHPSPAVLESLALVLGVQPSFFTRRVMDGFTEASCQFRAPRKMTAGLRTRVLSHGTLFQEFLRLLETRVRLPEVSVPSFRGEAAANVERAAETLRRSLALGLDRPVTHLPRVMERMGIVITRFEACGSLDAFSRPTPGARPVVVLNTDKGSTSRTRFDLAHELGHLVLHTGDEGYLREREEQADSFASAFLLPRVGFVREHGTRGAVDWDLIWEIKRRWKVSGAAILMRAQELRLIPADGVRRAWKHYMYKRWNHGEPYEPPDDAPELIRHALELLIGRTSATGIAEALGWELSTLKEVVGELPANLEEGPTFALRADAAPSAVVLPFKSSSKPAEPKLS